MALIDISNFLKGEWVVRYIYIGIVGNVDIWDSMTEHANAGAAANYNVE